MSTLLIRRIQRHVVTKAASFNNYLGLPPHPTKCQATYIWLNGFGDNLCTRTRTLEKVPTKISDYPDWGYAWKTTNGELADFYLKPVAAYPDPFLGGNNRLTLCETYDENLEPSQTNHRHKLKTMMELVAHEEPWFGVEQEYLLVDNDHTPLGWPKQGFPDFHPQFYCGVGANRAFGRDIVDTHYRACLHAGLHITGTNAEVTPSQWEFQIGPINPLSMGDELWLARYLLHRITETYGCIASLDPRPESTGVWQGAGCHTNFSTAKTRAPGGINELKRLVPKLGRHHLEHLPFYDTNDGKDNVKRLKNMFTTDEFTWGIGDRHASIRIPKHVALSGKGYFEDRRPSSNCDPYLVASSIISGALLS